GRADILGGLAGEEDAMTRSSHAKWFSWAPLLLIAVIVASPVIGEDKRTSSTCPGIPLLCGMACSLDAFGTPIYCSNGQCTCAPGLRHAVRPRRSRVRADPAGGHRNGGHRNGG